MICRLLILQLWTSYLPFLALKVFTLVLLAESFFKKMLFRVKAPFVVITNLIKSKTSLNEQGRSRAGPEPRLS